MKILLTGDIHLGRASTRVLERRSVSGDAFSSVDTWSRIVDYACRERFDVVAISGDVVDEENKYYEALGPLEKGLLRMTEAGIQVVAVAGNHDWDVLPEMATRIASDNFHLLGRNGKWEEREIALDGKRKLTVRGWSFPSRHYSRDPFEAWTFPRPAPGTKTLGLLHADVDAASSLYAPARLSSLLDNKADFWLLGHIHKPTVYTDSSGDPRALYPGTPQALNRGESGAHGPWILTFEDNEPPAITHVPLSTIRYDDIPVFVDDSVTGESDLRGVIDRNLRRYSESIADDYASGKTPDHVIARLIFEGRSPFHIGLPSFIEKCREKLDELGPRLESVEPPIYARRFINRLRSEIDLESLASGSHLKGVLARIVLSHSNEGAKTELLTQARAIIDSVDRSEPFSPLQDNDRETNIATQSKDDLARRLIFDNASRLLEELMKEKER